MQHECEKVIEKGRNKGEGKKTKSLIYQWKSTIGTVLVYHVRERAVRVDISHYTHMSPVFALPVNDSRCDAFPYLFGHLSEVLFQWPPSVSHDQRLPVNLSRSFSRPIDRSHRIDHLFSFFLSLSLSLALSDFSIDYSVRVFRSLFSTLLLALSLAQKLSIEQQGRSAWDTTVFCNCLSFCSAFVLLVTLFPMVTEPNTTAGLSDQRIFQLLCIRFVYFVVRRPSRCFERVHPFNFVHFASGAPPTRIFPLLVWQDWSYIRGDGTNSADL